MGYPALYTAAHRKQWGRIKSLDFPEGPVAIMDAQGKAVIHRPHSRRVLRAMARDAARRIVSGEISEMKLAREKKEAGS